MSIDDTVKAGKQSSNISRINQILGSILFFIIACFPLLLNSRYGIIDPFLQEHIASATFYLNKPHIPLESSFLESFKYIYGHGFLVIFISHICNISPKVIEYMLIAGIPFIFSIYILVRRFISITLMAYLITLIIVWKALAGSHSYYSVWPHSFGYLLFFLLVATYIDIEIDNKKDKKNLLVIIILFMGIHFYSYNAEFWVISFFLFINLFHLFSKDYKRLTHNLLLVFIAISLTFTRIVYERYIPAFLVQKEQLGENIEDFLSFQQLFPFFETLRPHEYYWIPPKLPWYLSVANSGWYIMIALPILIVIFSVILNLLKTRSLDFIAINPNRLKIIAAVFMVGFADFLSYILIGGIKVSFRYFFWIVPILTGIALISYLFKEKSHKVNKIHLAAYSRRYYGICVYLCLILVVSCTLHVGFISHGYSITSTNHYTDIEPSAFWFFDHSSEYRWVLSDHYTSGQYSIVAASLDQMFIPRLYTIDSYTHLVDPKYRSIKDQYFENAFVVVNKKLSNKKTTALVWPTDFAPLINYFSTIYNNCNLNKIYDDNTIDILYGR